jgi:hypothetical protein
MKPSKPKKSRVRLALEQLESRDMPSAAGAALPFIMSQLVVGKGLKNSDAWTANLQTDFNALQSDIVKLGPTNPTTIADLSRTMADYGFAEQTYNLADNTAELAKAGLVFGIANGIFDESDAGAILFSMMQIQSLQNTTRAQAATADAIAKTPFANGVTFGGQHTIIQLSRPAYVP